MTLKFMVILNSSWFLGIRCQPDFLYDVFSGFSFSVLKHSAPFGLTEYFVHLVMVINFSVMALSWMNVVCNGSTLLWPRRGCVC